MRSHYLAIFLFVALAELCYATKRHRVYFTGVECENFDKKLLPFVECFMLPDAQNQLMLNVRFKFGQVIVKDFNVNYQLIVEINGRNDTYINTKLDVCEAFGTPSSHFIIRLFSSEILRRINIHLKCPTKANVMYEMLNFTIDSKYALTFLPSLKWTSLAKFYLDNKKVFTMLAFGRVDKIK